MSYLTKAELAAVNESTLHKLTPYVIDDDRHEAMRFAKLDGFVKWHGDEYVYIDATGELIRDDVLKWLEKRRKTATDDKRKAAKAQRTMFE